METMTVIERCASCEYGKTELAPDKALALFCRRYPPQVVPVQAGGGQIAYMPMYPRMSDDTWCGEWKSRYGRPKDSGTA